MIIDFDNKMSVEITAEINYDSGSDESDCEDVGVATKSTSRDSNALLDTWLKELDSLTTVSKHRYFFISSFVFMFMRNCFSRNEVDSMQQNG